MLTRPELFKPREAARRLTHTSIDRSIDTWPTKHQATASVDPETDAALQEMVRREFRGSATVLTIAHRLHTICFYDAVIVLDKGRVVEQGAPLDLLRRPLPPPHNNPASHTNPHAAAAAAAAAAANAAVSGELTAMSSAAGDVVAVTPLSNVQSSPPPPPPSSANNAPCISPGSFRRLAEESGDYENLVRIAEEELRTGGARVG